MPVSPPKKARCKLSLGEGGDDGGVVDAGDVLDGDAQFPGKVLGELVVTTGQAGGVLVGDAADFEYDVIAAAAGGQGKGQDQEGGQGQGETRE